jgi:hypothetical protein
VGGQPYLLLSDPDPMGTIEVTDNMAEAIVAGALDRLPPDYHGVCWKQDPETPSPRCSPSTTTANGPPLRFYVDQPSPRATVTLVVAGASLGLLVAGMCLLLAVWLPALLKPVPGSIVYESRLERAARQRSP